MENSSISPTFLNSLTPSPTSSLRRVRYFTIENVNGKLVKSGVQDGFFHQWADDFELCHESSVLVPFTVAIVESLNGEVRKIDPVNMHFV